MMAESVSVQALSVFNNKNKIQIGLRNKKASFR